MAYIKGRQIVDGPLMTDEIISWAKGAKKMFFLKVDFEKASDLLNLSFFGIYHDSNGF